MASKPGITLLATVVSFIALALGILFTSARGFITFEMALLSIVALFAMYIGFGFLIAVYRMIAKLN